MNSVSVFQYIYIWFISNIIAFIHSIRKNVQQTCSIKLWHGTLLLQHDQLKQEQKLWKKKRAKILFHNNLHTMCVIVLQNLRSEWRIVRRGLRFTVLKSRPAENLTISGWSYSKATISSQLFRTMSVGPPPKFNQLSPFQLLERIQCSLKCCV